MEGKSTLDQILIYMPPRVRPLLERARAIYAPSVQEITLRAERPLCIDCTKTRYYVSRDGCLVEGRIPLDAAAVSAAELNDVFLRLCDYSVYARRDELVRGYLTASRGVRVGVCGSAVVRDGELTALRQITTLSFRVPREVKDCSEAVLALLRPLSGVLVCGAPCSGKTTLIRDMARRLSAVYRVSVIDERGELSAAGAEGFGYDMGLCDVLHRCPKSAGVMNAVRALAPDIIVCDELGEEADVAAVRYALRCGAAFVASIHAASINDLRRRAVTRSLLSTNAFRYLVFLGGRRASGTVTHIYEWSDRDA